MPRRKSFKSLSLAIVGLLIAATVALISPSGAGASSGPFASTVVTETVEPHVICRADGGSLGGNQEADQDLSYTLTYPRDVQQGDTFDIKIRQAVGKFPRTEVAPIVGSATVYNVWNQVTSYSVPAGLTINNVSLGPINGNVEADPEAGYYVNRDNVPTTGGTPNYPLPSFDPMTLAPSLRLPIPGITPNAYWNTTTNRVYTSLRGSGAAGSSSSGEFRGGSAVQAPTVTINVTATAAPGPGKLAVKLGGQLPGSEPRNYTGTQPGNFPAPSSGALGSSTDMTGGWASTNGIRYTNTDANWPDWSYTTTATANAILTVSAPAKCAPGYEVTSEFPTPPAYMTGPNAIPNGVSPPLSETVVYPFIDSTTPFEGASYPTNSSLSASYKCRFSFNDFYDTCVGDVDDGDPIDTSTPGPKTFTINATDANGDPMVQVINYEIADPLPPVAHAGAAQVNKVAGNVVTLNGSGTTDPNGPPALPLTYTWTQTGGPTVTLSDVNAVSPTFTVPPVTDPAGHTFTFDLEVDNGYFDDTASTSVTSIASTPTVTVAKSRPPGGTTFYPGDLTTLTANITNPDGTAPGDYTYLWSQTSGRTTTLSSTTAANPTYTMPSSGANPTAAACTSGSGATSPTSANCPRFQVVVTKTNTAKSSAAALLAAHGTSLPARPVANAGAAQTIPTAGDTVTLNGTGTQAQGHAVSYAWTQTSGPAVTLSDNTAAQPTFTLGAGGSSATSYGFSLVVTDTQSPIAGSGTNGNTSLASTTTVTQVADTVEANAGPNQTGKVAGNLITLDASASTDPNLAPLTYTWTQVANGAPTVTLSDDESVNPTFTVPAVDNPAGFDFQFNVTATNGGPNAGDTDTSDTPVSIAAIASTPTVTVNRTPSGTVHTGTTITLGTAITNVDGNNPADYTFSWTQASGRTTSLSSNTAANPTYVLPSSGSNPTGAACTSGTGATSPTSANCPRFTVVVTKTNTAKASAAASLAAHSSSLPTRPVANAGPDQNVKVGSGTITLDGTSSTQAQGHALSYAWTQTAGPASGFGPTTDPSPTFTAPNTPGTYTFSLVVTDTTHTLTSPAANQRVSAADAVTIVVSDYASPVVNPGPNQSVNVGTDGVQLAGSASQADNHALTYLWTQTGGTPVTLSDDTILNPTFDAPNVGTTLTFTLTATDTENPNPAAATTVSSVLSIGVGEFAAPNANPGPNQTVHRRDVVSLDASGSNQADGHPLTFHWEQTSGVPVTLSDPDVAQPTFTAPETPGTLKFQVTVTDILNPNPAVGVVVSAEVQIDVQDYAAPVANAGPNQTDIDVDATVTLDGSASYQDDSHPLTYLWTQIDNGAPTVTLSDPTAEMPTFTAPTGPVTLQFQLVVDDTFNTSSPDIVFIDVNGIAGLDFSANLEGLMQFHKAATPFKINVVNNGVLTRTVNAATLSVSIEKNNVEVPASQYVLVNKSVSLAAGKFTNFTLKWNHTTAGLNAGDLIEIKTCVNVFGDFNVSNNCSTKVEPPGNINVFAWPAETLAIKASSTTSAFKVWITNLSSFAVGPIRVADNLSATVRVNGGAPQPTTVTLRAPFTLGAPYLRTEGVSFKWPHAPLVKGDSVEVTACAHVANNTAAPTCWSRTVIATK